MPTTPTPPPDPSRALALRLSDWLQDYNRLLTNAEIVRVLRQVADAIAQQERDDA